MTAIDWFNDRLDTSPAAPVESSGGGQGGVAINGVGMR